jgi:hypothetical protein
MHGALDDHVAGTLPDALRARPGLIAAVLAVGIAAVVVPAPAVAASGYCSPTGDYCYSARDERGVVRIRPTTFSFQDPVNVCVSHRKGRTCHRFTPRAQKHGIFGFAIRWSRSFPNHGPGNYRVRFALGTGTSGLGPGVTFRRQMIGSVARAARCPCTVDAGRRGPKGDSGGATDPFGPWRSGAAGRGQMAVGVAESVI